VEDSPEVFTTILISSSGHWVTRTQYINSIIINSIGVGAKLKAIRDHPIILGHVPAGMIVMVRGILMSCEWFCAVRDLVVTGCKAKVGAVLKNPYMTAFETLT
jgi:hypothetical protein